MFLLKICSQKNDLNTVKIVFCDVIRCAIWVFNFTLLKSSFKIYYVPNEPSIYKMSVSYRAIYKIANSYRAMCKIAVFYRATWKVAVLYCAVCKIVASHCAIYKIAVSYRAICKIST